MTALQPPKLLLASPVLHKSWSFCPRPQVLLGFHPYSTRCPAVGSGASCALSVTCCALGAVGTKEVRDPCLKRVCVLIASCLLHFVPCFLKAVVALRGSRGAALFSAGLVGSPRGGRCWPQSRGVCTRTSQHTWQGQVCQPAEQEPSVQAGRQLLLPGSAPAAASRKACEPGMRKDAVVCARSWPFISETQPGQATGQKAKHPGKSSRSIRE